MIAVAREHEEVRVLGGRDDLALDATPPRLAGGRAAEACRGIVEQPSGLGLGDGPQRLGRRGWRRVPAQQRAPPATLSASVPATCSSVTSASAGSSAAASAIVASHVSSAIQTSARIPVTPADRTIGRPSPRRAPPVP